MRALLKRLRSDRGAPAPRGRLTEARAAEIAADAAAAAGFPGTVGTAARVSTPAGPAWDVCQVSIGSGWRIAVDDATGLPGPVGRWGIR